MTEVRETRVGRSHPATQHSGSTVVDVQFTFPDWPGEHDVIGVCQDYMNKLTEFVETGASAGAIAG